MVISEEIKKQCVELRSAGQSAEQIYRDYFSTQHPSMSLESFSRSLRKWRKRFADDTTLEKGTYEGFTAHAATVQVNAQGEIIQAWVKQHLDDGQFEELIEAIKENVQPIDLELLPVRDGEGMLEVPLYDMHFPLSDHSETLPELAELISGRHWEVVNIVIGQDLFHNDDMRGRTASGRPIEKVDIPHAWRLARAFWVTIIAAALENAERVKVIYSKGNHDESLAWAFVQMLKEAFPQVEFDDDMKPRKVIYWRGCFIGVTHGNATKSGNGDLRGQFTIEFPQYFAASAVREIHCGHLHHEKTADNYGVMIRRLSRNGDTDTWSEDEGFVGAHKRFMVFEWKPSRLSKIHYL